MAQDLFQYDKMIEAALLGIVRDALARVAREGLPGEHHFYIGFATKEPGVRIPAALLARFPDEMTVVIQHQFWDLKVDDEAFAVTLSFQRQPERLVVPFAAIKSFTDPSVNFALEFTGPPDAAKPDAGAVLPAPVAVAAAPAKPDRPSGEVVALDKFRKR